jgi:hypothetical protein
MRAADGGLMIALYMAFIISIFVASALVGGDGKFVCIL